MLVALDSKKLLGFRILNVATEAKVGTKPSIAPSIISSKIGGKVGSKPPALTA